MLALNLLQSSHLGLLCAEITGANQDDWFDCVFIIRPYNYLFISRDKTLLLSCREL